MNSKLLAFTGMTLLGASLSAFASLPFTTPPPSLTENPGSPSPHSANVVGFLSASTIANGSQASGQAKGGQRSGSIQFLLSETGQGSLGNPGHGAATNQTQPATAAPVTGANSSSP